MLARQLEKHIASKEVYGLAIRQMAPVLLHAAAFDPVFTRLVLIEPFTSYSSLVRNQYFNSGFIHSAVPGSLTRYDLSDLAAALATRRLLVAGVTDHMGNNVRPDSASGDLDVIRAAYHARNADDQLSILPGKTGEKPDYPILDWIR